MSYYCADIYPRRLFLLLSYLALSLLGIEGFSQQQAFTSPAGTQYLLYTPPGYYSSTTSAPLLISLHTKGEIGNDLAELTSLNPEQMPCRLIYLNRWPQDLPFIVLTPQLRPTEENPDPQWSAEYIDEVVLQVVANYRIDPTRIYLTGISRGGTGVWTYASAFPNKIAAIVTASGRSDLSQACPIKDIPVWAFHGDDDTTAPPEFSIDMINAINACQPKGIYTPRLTILNAKAHNGWNEVYNGTHLYRVFEWLLKFRKGDLSNKTPYVSAGQDYTIKLKDTPLKVYGDFFDADGAIASVSWTQVAGAPLTLTNADTKVLSISNLTPGIFEFQLTVKDNLNSASTDRVKIEILSAAIQPELTGLILVNGSTNAEVGPLFDGQVIDKAALGLAEINIKAVAAGALSVRFSVNADMNTRTVNSSSTYFIKSQTTGPEWKIKDGEYLICATPYSRSSATGVRGTSQCFLIIVGAAQNACVGTGTIVREVWSNIPGKTISSIPVTSTPSATSELLRFQSPTFTGDNYGARIRGYVCPPTTGDYTFYISSDDNSELWLSSDESPANKSRIASVTGYTNILQWDKYLTQKSAVIKLRSGSRYYIEALHKEATGGDHLAVGWQLPNTSLERPIPGTRLIPYNNNNTSPEAVITNPTEGQTFANPQLITIKAAVSDSDGTVSKVDFRSNGSKLGEVLNSPFDFTWTNIPGGSHELTVVAYDNAGASTVSTPVRISVSRQCDQSGFIMAEYWANVTGINVSDIPINTSPTSTAQLAIFESPANRGSDYGTRIRGFICPPMSGTYRFWISSDDKSELWLSSNADMGNKVKIASVIGYTSYRIWNKYTSQQSQLISLVQGQTYYIEALHKEGSGVDHVSVGWQLPDGVLERPIPGNRLISFAELPFFRLAFDADHSDSENTISVYPNPVTDHQFNVDIKSSHAEPREVRILNLSGQTIFQNSYYEKTITITLGNDVPPGLYILLQQQQGRTYSHKVTIK